MKHDIRNLDDIKVMVNSFYDRVKKDPLLAPVFFEKIPGDWAHHLETLYQFWNATLFAVQGYKGNPFHKHVNLPLGQEHFKQWVNLFYETIDELFMGQNADNAKFRAITIAEIFYSRMNINVELHPLPAIKKK